MQIRLTALNNASAQVNAVTGSVNNLNNATKKVSKSTQTFGQKMMGMGSQINVLGQRMTWMVSVPLLAFANKSINTAIDIETSWVRFRKVFSGTEEDIVKLQKTAVELSNKFGKPVEEISNIMAEFNKAGVESVSELEILSRVVAETSIIFDTDMTTALDGAKSVMLGFNLTAKETEDALSAINIIADKTTASEQGILEVFNRAGGVARQYGLSVRELAASQSVFEKNAIPAGRAGNAMKSILISLGKSSNIAKDQFRELGINMDSTIWKTASAGDKLDLLAKKHLEVAQSGNKLAQAQLREADASLVGKFQASNLAVVMEDLGYEFDNNTDTISQWKEGLRVSSNETENLKFKNQQLAKVLESSPAKLEIMNQMYRNQSAIIGNQLLPYKMKLLEILSGLLEKFNNLSPGMQNFIINVGLFLAIAGPFLAMTGLMISAIGGLITILKTVVNSFKLVEGAMTFKWGLIANPWFLLATAITVAIGLILIEKGKLKGALDDLGKTNTTLNKSSEDAFNNAKKKMEEAKKLNMDALKIKDPEKKAGMLKEANKKAESAYKLNDIAKKNAEMVKANDELIARYSRWNEVWYAVYDETVQVWNNITSWLVAKWEEIKLSVSTKWEEIKQSFLNAMNNIWQSIADVWNEIIRYITEDLWGDLTIALGFLITAFILLPVYIYNALRDLGKYLWDNIFVPAWKYLEENFPRWMEAILKWFKEFPCKAVEACKELGKYLWDNVLVPAGKYLAKNFPKWIDTILKWFRDLPSKIAESLAGLGKSILDAFKRAFKWVSVHWKEAWSSSKFSDGVKKALKLAGFNEGGIVQAFNNGGLVYATNGFLARGRDTVSAMLSPGEMVLNKSQQSSLFDLLSGRSQMQGAGGPTINLNVGTMIASRGEQREFARRISDLINENNHRY